MSHYFGIVLVKPGCNDIRAEVERIIAPYSENQPAYDEMTEENYIPGVFWWDWWRVGGRWDGVIRGLDAIEDGKGGFNFEKVFETLERNAIPVIEMGECRPFTLVTPDGAFAHRERYVPDPEGRDSFPWKYEEDPEYDRWCGEQLIAHRDCIAVGIDYHD